MSRKIVFIDPVSMTSYGGVGEEGRALGGTEATVLRVARWLSGLGHRVTVAQTARKRSESDDRGVLYCPYDVMTGLTQPVDSIVLLRAQKLMARICRQYPNSQKLLWLHCFPGRRRRGMVRRAETADFTIVTVSEALRQAVLGQSPGLSIRQTERVKVIANVVDVGQAVSAPWPRDPNSLVHFSSPHKGLQQVLENFAHLRRHFPEIQLSVANPGYLAGAHLEGIEGVIDIGSLSHDEVLRHVGEAFCVFCAQSQFAETFGLVFAEANALRTPVIAHPIGAAPEVLSCDQLANCDDPEAVLSLYSAWRSQGPPEVGFREEFSMDSVGQRWLEVLQSAQTPQEEAAR